MGVMPVVPSVAEVAQAIRQVQAGDIEAFSTVVRAYQHPLRAWASRWCVPGIEADDIAHRAFIVAFRGIHDFTADGNCFAWLCTITRNVLRDELKRLRRERSRFLDGLVAIECSEAIDDLTARGGDDRRIEAMRDCLQRLPLDGMELVRRHYTECEPLARIAEQQGKTLAAVKSRLHWLRGKLRDCLVAKLGDRCA